MSKDWTEQELRAASAAMKKAGQMSYEEMLAVLAEQKKASEIILAFAADQVNRPRRCPRCGKERTQQIRRCDDLRLLRHGRSDAGFRRGSPPDLRVVHRQTPERVQRLSGSGPVAASRVLQDWGPAQVV